MSRKPISSLPLSPSSISAITRAGYNTVGELAASNAETLARDLNISLPASQAILDAAVPFSTAPSLSFGLSAATYVSSAKFYPSSCPPLDTLLNGGLPRGHILELSGPPGTCKERLALKVACNVVRSGEGVLWVEMQNFVSPSALKQAILDSCPSAPHAVELVTYLSVQSLAELLVFVNNLPTSLEDHSSISAIVFNSIWFPFQTAANLAAATRRSLLDRVKHIFTRLCAERNVTIVTTTQLSTKLLSRDGTPANFDTGSRAVLVPHLGGLYLPFWSNVSDHHRPRNQNYRYSVLRVLSSPGNALDGQPAPEQRYQLIDGEIQRTAE